MASTKRQQGGEMLAAISTRMVQAIARTAGRGPEHCRTYWAGDDMLVVLMSAAFSKAEESLIFGGHSKEMHASRRALQEGLEDELRGIVEEETGREVTAFMASSHVDPDLMVEVFVMAPPTP